MIRADQKGRIETVEPVAGISVACKVKASTEMSRSPGVVEARAEGWTRLE